MVRWISIKKKYRRCIDRDRFPSYDMGSHQTSQHSCDGGDGTKLRFFSASYQILSPKSCSDIFDITDFPLYNSKIETGIYGVYIRCTAYSADEIASRITS